MAGESPSLVSGGLRNLLCRTFSEGNKAWTQSELLGLVGGLQILTFGRTNDRRLRGSVSSNNRYWGWKDHAGHRSISLIVTRTDCRNRGIRPRRISNSCYAHCTSLLG